ncbi:MAG: hypothetical protein V2J02_19260, partial [Pseudomonadales bacterium]|nr:hypothetical protein [Pseudomonadales bacterium]
GAPWTVGDAGRGRVFELPVGPALRVDVPLDVVDLGATPSRLELFALAADDPAATPTIVSPSACPAGAVPLPRGADGALLELPMALPLTPSSGFASGETLFLRVIDRDADLDPFAPDRVSVTLAVDGAGARVQLVLTETGASTGRFTGHLPVGGTGACALAATPDARLTARYEDADDADDTATAEATLDPSARVFDAATGAPIDGVRVNLVDADTGAPATVRAVDGVTAWPATIVTGRPFTDGAGNAVDLGPGRFRFPQPAPGRYRLEVEPPEAFRFPSTAEDEALGALEGGPFAIAPGSRGEVFAVPDGGLPRLDVPLDPVRVELFLSKQARSPSTAIGDFLPWEIRVQNPSAFALTDVVLEDVLPPGFRLEPASLSADTPDASVSVADDGRRLAIRLPSLAAGGNVAVRYVTEVTAGARLGEAVNRVRATGPGVRGSNVAEARVAVREDLLRDRAVLLGRVLSGGCAADEGEAAGVAGVRLYLEDGTYVVTDREGRWHVEGVRPGTHVVQLDVATLPDGLEPVLCEAGNRAGGTAFSRFVDVQGGTLWRTDFRLRGTTPEQAVVRQALAGEVDGDRVRVALTVEADGASLSDLVQSVMVPAELRYLPGSARIDGRAAEDPESSGDVLTWRSAGLGVGAARELAFDLAPRGATAGAATASVRAMALFRDETGARHRLPVATLEIGTG